MNITVLSGQYASKTVLQTPMCLSYSCLMLSTSCRLLISVDEASSVLLTYCSGSRYPLVDTDAVWKSSAYHLLGGRRGVLSMPAFPTVPFCRRPSAAQIPGRPTTTQPRRRAERAIEGVLDLITLFHVLCAKFMHVRVVKSIR
jgi:hypothetical protein